MLKFLGRGSAFTEEHNSAYFIENDELILIDCPMSAFIRLNDKNLALFDHIYVLVTHTHGDHSGGIGMLIDLLQFSVKTPITIVAPSKEVEADLFYLLSRIEGCSSSWYELINVEDLDKGWFVRSIPTTHTEELEGKCFGFQLKVEGRNVVYTGDTNTLIPYEPYIEKGTYLYCEISAYKSPVHLYCTDVHDKIKDYIASGVSVYLMHMDDERRILQVMSDTGAELAPLELGGATMEDNGRMLSGIFDITNSLYKDMCMNDSKDHNLLFSYLTELSKTIVDADRASFWKWDKRKGQIWTLSAMGIDKIVVPDNTGLVGKALRTKRMVITNDPYNDPDFNREVDLKTGYTTKSILVLPVADINGNFIGALQIINKNDEHGFDEDADPKKLSLAALVCGIALESETFLEDSHHDRLTGLRNRMGFYYDFAKRFKEYMIPAAGKTMSVFICDIDKFKNVNDTYGHKEGDRHIKAAADVISQSFGMIGDCYRTGGDEFIVVIEDLKDPSALKEAEEKFRKLIDEYNEKEKPRVKLEIPYGIEEFDLKDKDVEKALRLADGKMYSMKKQMKET